MDTESTINLLLVDDDIDEANRFVSLLRNANYTVDPHYAANAAELNKRIQERNWDLVLAQYTASTIPARNVIHQIRRLNKDIPVIFIIGAMDTGLIVDALKMGAVDAVPVDEDQFFIQSVARALFNLEQRRRLRYWKRRFSESEDRFESLILSSQDGIAIIQEGTYVHVNSAFAGFFGFIDAESMTLLPVFDTIADASQGEFKRYLKPLDAHDAWDTEVIRFDGIRPDGTTMHVQATLSQIDFHGEQALQMLVKKEFMGSAASAASTSELDQLAVQLETDVSKIRLQEMVEGINGTIRRAAKSGEDALLFYVEVDRYEEIQRHLGIGEAEEGLTQLAHFLDGLIPDKTLFGRIREEAFTFIIASSDAEKGLSLANRLVKEVSSQIFATNDGSFTCTVSIGITPIGEATASADEALTACQQAVADLQFADSSGKSGNGAKFHEPVFDLSSSNISDADILRIGKTLLKKNLVDVAFQPIISLHGAQDELYEVLMRIKPDAFAEGEIPSDFVNRIFKTEIGRELDRAVISEALQRLAAKKQISPETRLVINLSETTIGDEKFVSWLQKTLESFTLAPGDLIFQMREIDISRQLGNAARMLERLKNFGSGTGLTHYGLAINPLTIFNKISVDYVKIDSVLSDKAQKDKAALTTLKALIAELKAPQRKIIVPFIESATVIPSLWQAGVDFLQGHYIQAPQAEMNFDFSED